MTRPIYDEISESLIVRTPIPNHQLRAIRRAFSWEAENNCSSPREPHARLRRGNLHQHQPQVSYRFYEVDYREFYQISHDCNFCKAIIRADSGDDCDQDNWVMQPRCLTLSVGHQSARSASIPIQVQLTRGSLVMDQSNRKQATLTPLF